MNRKDREDVCRRQSSVKRIDKGARARARAMADMPEEVHDLALSFLNLRRAAEDRKIGWSQSFFEGKPSSLYVRLKGAPIRFSQHARVDLEGRAEPARDVAVPPGLTRSQAKEHLESCIGEALVAKASKGEYAPIDPEVEPGP